MTHPPRHDLFVSERPLRSDFAREKSYARRRLATLAVLILVIGGAVYGVWGRGASTPAEIPTIKSAGDYKVKPENPGGIEIPHQDVQLYGDSEAKGGAVPIEHLLPPPETPKEAPQPPPSVTEGRSALEPVPQKFETTVAPVPAPIPVEPKPVANKTEPVKIAEIPPPVGKPLSIEQILEETKPAAPVAAPVKAAPVVAGVAVIQLASLPDEAKARDLMKTLQAKYASILAGAVLHVAQADLGARGVYFRIQSQGLSETEASRVCSALKQQNAGCILVRK